MSQSKITAQNTVQKNLFQVLEEGDRKIKKIHEQAILFVGLSRSGKSTSFNWALGHQMIGVVAEGKNYYQNYVNHSIMAKLSPGFTSTTLIPNISILPGQNGLPDTSLLDMAGFLDNRNYIGVMGVSYFLKSVFDRVKKVKFVIVVSYKFFEQGNGQSIIKTFNGFFKMFDLQNLTENVKNDLYKSITMLVTRSSSSYQSNLALKSCIKSLSNQQFQDQNKDEIITLLQHLQYQSKIQYFPESKEGQYPPPCQMFKNMAKFGWQFFDIEKAQQQCKCPSGIINIPFKEDYQVLNRKRKNDVKAFKLQITTKINNYEQFKNHLDDLFQSFIDNWKQYRLNPNKQNSKNILDFSNFFIKMQKYLEKIDVYQSDKMMKIITPEVLAQKRERKRQRQSEIKQKYLSKSFQSSDLQLPTQISQRSIKQSNIQEEKPKPNDITFVSSFQKIIQIFQDNYKFIQRFMNSEFIPTMIEYRKIFNQFIDHIDYFSKTVSEKDVIVRLHYILSRGFYQFSQFYEIDKQTIHGAQREIKDKCPFDLKKEQFIYQFFSTMNEPVLKSLFSNSKQIEQFQHFFKFYVPLLQNYTQQSTKQQINTNDLMIVILQLKININIQNKDQHSRKVACKALIQLFYLLIKQAQSNDNQQQSKEKAIAKLKTIYLKQEQVIFKLGINLLKLSSDKFKQAKKLALNLMKNIHCFNQACRIYQQIIVEQQHDLIALSQTYEDYAQYCLFIGKIKKAISLLGEKLQINIESGDTQGRQKTKQKLVNAYNHSINRSQFLKLTQQQIYNNNDYNVMLNSLVDNKSIGCIKDIQNMLIDKKQQSVIV